MGIPPVRLRYAASESPPWSGSIAQTKEVFLLLEQETIQPADREPTPACSGCAGVGLLLSVTLTLTFGYADIFCHMQVTIPAIRE